VEVQWKIQIHFNKIKKADRGKHIYPTYSHIQTKCQYYIYTYHM